jgi:phosphoglycolate phosphatase-like HAD superfamily hydrolase
VGTAAILDVDGTLVDSNYQHSVAWYRAFREHELTVPVWKIHRHIGMGGDQLVPALLGDELAAERGDEVREAEKRLFAELIDEVVPLPGARELIVELKDRGHTVVLASSAHGDDVEHYIDLLEAREIVDAWTTSADVEQTKPEPDLVGAAIAKAGELSAVMVGDSVWDVIAATRAELKTIGVLSGGFSEAELRESGAVAVFESVLEVRQRLDSTPLR